MKKFLGLLAIITSAISFTACSHQEDTSLSIVTSIPPLYSLTANLLEGIENAELSNIIPPNTSVHSFSLSPEIAKKINDADLIIINGFGLEEFLEESSFKDSAARIIESTNGITPFKAAEPAYGEPDADSEVPDSDTDKHGTFDPHVWLNPQNAKIQTINIAEALKKQDPKNAVLYEANLQKLNARLDALDFEIKEGLDQLEIEPYIVFHDAYQYFEEHYKIRSVAFLEEFPGKEPSPGYLATVIDLIKKNDVKAIFTEPQFSPKLVQTLSKDYTLKVAELNPDGGILTKDGYFELMRKNLKAFQTTFVQK